MMRVPRLVPGCDIKSLPLKTEEGYLLSRIDGVVSERELSLITGLSPAEVSIALDRLVVLGAVDFGDNRPPVSRRGPAVASATAGVISTRGNELGANRTYDPALTAGPPPSRRFDAAVDSPPASRRLEHGSDQPPPPTRRSLESGAEWRVVDPPPDRRPAPPADLVIEPPPPTRRGAELTLEPSRIEPPRILPVEIDEQVDIDHSKKKKIIDLFDALESKTHYEMLELPVDADKKRVKSAYYSIAPEFHPDKYFRKRLGPYKAKIEAIFARLTLAHDVLTSKQRRAEYDAYLEQLRRNRTMAALLEHDPMDVPTVVAAVDDDPLNPPPTARGRPAVEGDAAGPESARIRRAQVSKPVNVGVRGSSLGSSGSTGVDASRRVDPARPDPRRLQLERYLLAAKVALERRDLAAAANAYRLAAAIAPDDEALVRKAQEVQRNASAELSDGFVKQADYEASQGRWLEAAASYTNGSRSRPDDARLHERVAFATLQTGQNARRAVDYARRAVKLAPQSAEYRVTLVRAYVAAGLETSARAEVERLAELAPNDAKLRDVIAQLRSLIKKADTSDS